MIFHVGKTFLQSNILFVDKPKGITSFDVIRRLRKKLGVRKLGHAGTLDPLASGLLIIGIGEGTKRLNEFLKSPKTYEVEVLLGVQTDTGDMEGKIVREFNYSQVLENLRIENESMNNSSLGIKRKIKEKAAVVLEALVGFIDLPVPVYSAIKRGGEPLYKKARRGEQFEPPKKEMEIRRISLREMRREGEHIILALEMDVGSGTYVRSIAEEIGRRLDVPATTKELRRTKIGEFDVKDAIKIEEVAPTSF